MFVLGEEGRRNGNLGGGFVRRFRLYAIVCLSCQGISVYSLYGCYWLHAGTTVTLDSITTITAPSPSWRPRGSLNILQTCSTLFSTIIQCNVAVYNGNDILTVVWPCSRAPMNAVAAPDRRMVAVSCKSGPRIGLNWVDWANPFPGTNIAIGVATKIAT